MKSMIQLLLCATSTFSAMIPLYPEYANKPDSAHVISAKTNKVNYTIKFSYNSDGYLLKEVYATNGQQTDYAECHYQKSGDTVKCTYTISDEPTNQYVDLYIFDNSGKIIRFKGYDGTDLYDEEVIQYNQDNKIVKTVTAVASLAADMGDSAVYKYQNGKIKTVEIYGDNGSKWSYSDYETDNLGRVTKTTEYDCENGCVADTEYMVYFYGNTHVRYVPPAVAKNNNYDLSLSDGNAIISMCNGTKLFEVSVYDLLGNRIKSAVSTDKKSVSLSQMNFTGQQVILQLNTSTGNVSVPIVLTK
jgi:hypothetical protein